MADSSAQDHFAPDPAKTYEMPVVFGPALAPDVTHWGGVLLASASYVTDRAAAARYVPHHFRLADEAVVNIVRVAYDDVDYIEGSYNEFGVGISVVHDGPEGPTSGVYYLAMWLDRTEPITVGRELLGYAKIGGQLPPIVREGSAASFVVADNGQELASGAFEDLTLLDPPRHERLAARFDPSVVLGWKYIPAVGGGADADYPTRIPLYFEFDRIWTGAGTVEFASPSQSIPPLSRRILAGLATLPVLEWRRSFVGEGRGTLPRNQVTRLESVEREQPTD